MHISGSDVGPPYGDVGEINIPFPTKKCKKLLAICLLNEKSKLGPHQMSQIFVNAVYQFLLGNLSQDELSVISNKLWSDIKGPSEKLFGTLGSALYAASEMSFYIRRIYDPKNKHKFGSFERWMVDVMEYYEMHSVGVVKGQSIV